MRKNAEHMTRPDTLERIKNFRLMDDVFMTKCFEGNIECTELVLRIVMERPDLKVLSVKVQSLYKNLQGRSLTLDIDATDSKGRRFDIEVQRADSGASPRRARYHASVMDANTLQANEDFEALPELYVIFITEHDVLGGGLPLYHINRHIEEMKTPFDDGEHFLFVNGECRDDTPLGLLMQDFFCTNPDDMHYALLKERARYFKEDEKGVMMMSSASEELREEGREEGREEAREEFAVRLLKKGKMSYEEIAEISSLTLEKVMSLAKTQPA
ncbi:MAG: hypothetical protein E7199_09335 [Schwartzia succinivorans]|nr:hypothetical protein [Schwartzia succinivorans]